MSTNTFDSEDFVTYGGRAIHRSVIHQKIASLGWKPDQTAMLTDEQVKQVMEGRLAPSQIDLLPAKPGTSVILDQGDENFDEDEAAIMGRQVPSPATQSGVVLEAAVPRRAVPAQPGVVGRRLTGVKPPASREPAQDPVAPAQPTIGRVQPVPQPLPPPPPPPVPIAATLPQPSTDWKQVVALLDAAIALAENEMTRGQAVQLVSACGLWEALEGYNKAIYEAIAPEVQAERQDLCIGGTVLKIEIANGGIHILTTKGTLTATGLSLNLTKQEQ